jgi:hypothetical protein
MFLSHNLQFVIGIIVGLSLITFRGPRLLPIGIYLITLVLEPTIGWVLNIAIGIPLSVYYIGNNRVKLPKGSMANLYFVTILLFALFTVISLTNANNIAISEIIKHVVLRPLKFLNIGIILFYGVRSINDFNKILLIYTLVVFVEFAVIGILQIIYGERFFEYEVEAGRYIYQNIYDSKSRLTGFNVTDSVTAAGITVLPLSYAVLFLFKDRRLIFLIISIVFLIALLLTWSRTAIIFSIIIIAYSYFNTRSYKSYYINFFILFSIVAGLVVLPNIIENRGSIDKRYRDNSSWEGRLFLYKKTLDNVSTFNIGGYQAKEDQKATKKLDRLTLSTTTENTSIQFFFERGIGAVLLYWLNFFVSLFILVELKFKVLKRINTTDTTVMLFKSLCDVLLMSTFLYFIITQTYNVRFHHYFNWFIWAQVYLFSIITKRKLSQWSYIS